ncbi:4-hydroxy-3-methylbut-2-en-1-yl diphosphate synthase [Bacteroides propionicifaciens]|uniref:4-hydroxy-3-methylbut-2-en-1-yl diphosphate synthase n=1 Tax=Bacteroides propionicifaciens TaxID=392838 RepID=UPI0003626A78|nr:4-hydroxy-3-methylbut-2-en-1-yl diphosphate synthase [Bacteroides propionicifaciens]
MNLFNYSRRKSSEVEIGDKPLGKENPIRIQSMTNTSTQDVDQSVSQVKRIVDAGADYVRLTTQGLKEVESLKKISAELKAMGYSTPLVADVHFNPKVADVAATIVEKVRINPGNYVDPARTFKSLSYTDQEYETELDRIRKRLTDFINICKENRTAIRIGVNHGSLSDRIMSHYGDTPAGMVESCMEFLRICKAENFDNVVISIKASNTVVMVQTVRLLVRELERENMSFPLHLGVTEAGEGEDGRIKSALGIGTLLADGYGDTIRVSLSEAPEREIAVAQKLVDHILTRQNHSLIKAEVATEFNYFEPSRRKTHEVKNIGGHLVPVVISDRLDGSFVTDKNFIPDYLFVGDKLPKVRESSAYILDALHWQGDKNSYPAFTTSQIKLLIETEVDLKFLFISLPELTEDIISMLKKQPEVVLIGNSSHQNRLGEQRALAHKLTEQGITNPLIWHETYKEDDLENIQIKSAADLGPLILDGFCDGIFLQNQGVLTHAQIDSTAFSVLQAGRVRTSKTEFISCPGCGRTLFNLESTIAKVKAATKHLKGLKIGIMGCIVNGPGEMADSDYGYVGAARGKVSLYKKKECIEKNIPEEHAVERLIQLIKDNGDYVEDTEE